MNSLFRKQKIFDRDGNPVEEEYLYKDINELLKIQNDISKKIAKDLELLEKFLIEDNGQNPDTVPHFNLNCETIVEKNSSVKRLFKKYVTDNKTRIIEILETAYPDKDYQMGKKEINKIRELRNYLNIDYAFDDYPVGSSNIKNIKKCDALRGIKIDRGFWDRTFKNYNKQNKLKVLKRAFQMGMKKAIKNGIEAIIIEGIETKEQWDFIKSIDVPEGMRLLGQGFYLHKPE